MRRPQGSHPYYWRAIKQLPPADWKPMIVSELAEVTKGKLPKSLFEKPTEKSIPYLLIEGLNDGLSFHTEDSDLPLITTEDTVLVADGSRSGLPIRGVSGALGSTLLRYRSKLSTDQDFLFYLLESLYPYMNSATIGGSIPHLDKKLLNNTELNLPSTSERQAIGRILLTVDDLASAMDRELQTAQRLKTALIQQLFTRGMPGRHKTFTTSQWIISPSSWRMTTLSKIADITSGFTMGRELANCQTVIVPYVTVANVQDGYLQLTNIGHAKIKASEMESGLLQPDDIIMTEGGDRDKLGRGCIWSGQIEPCAFQNHIFRVRFNREECLPKLFHYLIQTWGMKRYFFSHAKQTSNLCTINSRELKNLPIGLPDLEEQHEIVSILDQVESSIVSVHKQIGVVKRLKTSLLQNLLTGKIRIPKEA